MKHLFPLILFFAIKNLSAQEPCLFDNYNSKYKQSIEHSGHIIQKNIKPIATSAKAGTIRVIPVVVHVIHNGGVENISNAQIQSQFDVLTEDFRKTAGSNGDGNGVDTELEFRLAKITPDGKCTDGIVRIKSTLTNHQTHQRTQLGNLSFWDNTRYLNVYIVKSINNGSAGYSSFPGGPDNDDGIVVMHNYFGKTGTASSGMGRTMSHEIGHWLGLYHTFQDGCGTDPCTEGDYVCDTPPEANPANFNCPIINSCNNDFPDLNDQVQNYMDYSADACRNMFTSGQKQRMDATLNAIRWNIWQEQNVISTGCDSGYVSPSCNVIADFTSNGQNICRGSSVVFTSKSQNTPLTHQWYFPGGNPSSSTVANPTVVFDSVGNYSITLIATNTIGTDSTTFLNYIVVTDPSPGAALSYAEGFEDPVFPSNGITIENPDTGVTWERDTNASVSGQASIKINNLININYGQGDAFILPELNPGSFAGSPYLTFKWAYARTSTIYSDELIVLLSKDCGLNFTQIFYKTGTTLSTAPVQTTPFVPDSSQWKSAKVNLTLYKNYNNIILKFVNVTDGGNNLYIDNIQVGDTVFLLDNQEFFSSGYSLKVFPNPAISDLTVQYKLAKAETVQIKIYDVYGKEIKILEDGRQVAGNYTLSLNHEKILSPGIYFLEMKLRDKVEREKIIISGF